MNYEQIEQSMMPMIRRRAQRLRNVMDPEDAVQEARIALFNALKTYDKERQPDVKRYVGRCLSNAFNTMYRKETTRRRTPWVASNGTMVPVPPDEFEEGTMASEQLTAEDVVAHREGAEMVAKLAASIQEKLSMRDMEVMYAFIAPPPELGEVPTNQDVADHLNINKNALDWSLHKIRKLMLAEMRSGNISKKMLQMVTGHGWPHSEASAKWDDRDFVAQVIWDRDLCADVVRVEEVERGDAAMRRLTFRWGTAVTFKLGHRVATMVMIGRYNPTNNLLFGSVCGCESVAVPWYSQALKVLGQHG